MIALIDYGSGNLHSVRKALLHEGAQVDLVSTPDGLAGKSGVVLPGVGAFGDCVRGLQSRGLWEPLRGWLLADRPFLGICLGYQMLFESSEESPGVAGFGVFKGRVKRFDDCGLKIPQIGWNALALTQPGHVLWRGLPEKPFVYFVHSFFPVPEESSVITATAEYGETFAASCGRGNIAAAQFHPEKSQAVGLRMIRNFVEAHAAP
jgi:glutamine amidotransferase